VSATWVDVDGRSLSLSNLDKVLWPATGFTKGQMIDYYARVAPVLVPHLAGRPLTVRRFPDGVEATSFFEKNCPRYRPEWMSTIEMGDVRYCEVDQPAALIWLANLAAIELHPTLACAPHLDQPTSVVFDLDPGAPADVLTCGRVALMIRELLDQLSLRCWVKTSGSKGLQLYVPLNSGVTYERARPFSQAVARVLERREPSLVVTTQDRKARHGKVLIDWSQNTASKTTVGVYSLRARDTPSVSTPVTWDELERALADGDPGRLRFEAPQALERLARDGDLLAPLLSLRQEIPRLSPG
jgi:bifunctional non-homologous end joining protein LigD